ncbi:T6SS immunity protein Tli4 family protein [Variovorax sp. VNK109]|uniref:T6SS immunity protein Tli4 family protein n=1 Tax=Variovorax sp. VNK109 TaxID=3400919 RepID=UPI003C0C5162
MDTFSTHMRTHCVGRYLIDLSEDMGSPRLAYSTFYFGLDADFKKVEVQMPERELIDHDRFSVLVTQRRNELRDNKNEEMKIPLLLAEEIVPTPNGEGLLLRYLENRNFNISDIDSELHVYVRGVYLVLRASSFVPGNPFRIQGDHYKAIDPVPSENRLKHFAQHLTGTENPGTAGPGFCIGNVLFPQPAIGYDEEKATFTFRKKWGESVSLNLDVSMGGKYGYERTSLFELWDRGLREMSNFEDPMVRQLYRRERTLEGGVFQEAALQAYWSRSRKADFKFHLQNLRPEEEAKLAFERPAISVQLETDSPEKGTESVPYRQDDLQRAWNQWVGSLRLSPGNGGAR